MTEVTVKNRGGKPFVKGDPRINREGRPPGSFSITEIIKKKLQELPKGERTKTYVVQLVEKILDKAIKDGDQPTQKMIWNYIDGLPKGTLDLTNRLVVTKEDEDNSNDAINKYLNGDTTDTTGE